jgi:dTDP-4-dehydrorhamnose reductase
VNVLITGAGGQLGRALLASSPIGIRARGVTHAELDIADESAVERAVREFETAVIINAAAFTRVDDAETERAAAERANAAGPAVLAEACRRAEAWLVQVSTDCVFDGKQNRPYAPRAAANPQSVYGRTKLEGERAVTRTLPSQSTIVRASWVYSADGRNFLTTMLKLMKNHAQLTIVSDQLGAPTSVASLARVLWALTLRRAEGIYHWCDSGVASRYDFAVAIAEEARTRGLLATSPAILPIASVCYPRPAHRPPCSLLDKRDTERLLGVTAPHWRNALRETLNQVATAGGVR